jgi:hypothetical protein
MPAPGIPQRIPPLSWRKPAFLWTPIALAAAVGWPAALFYNDSGPQRLALIAGAIVFALALISLGLSWASGQAPRSRRTVVLHVVLAGALVTLVAPFVLTQLLATVASSQDAASAGSFTLAMSLAMAPLAIVVGLPIVLVSGIIFSWLALSRRRRDELLNDGVFRDDVQPFR